MFEGFCYWLIRVEKPPPRLWSGVRAEDRVSQQTTGKIRVPGVADVGSKKAGSTIGQYSRQ